MKQMKFRDFFEKCKTNREAAHLLGEFLIASIKVSMRIRDNRGETVDTGELLLNTIASYVKMHYGVELTNKEEITAEYFAEVMNAFNIAFPPVDPKEEVPCSK